MAAGLGSRYGWLKQIDPVGPYGEILLEFALKDALTLGIEEVVVIVSETIRDDFESMIVTKYPALKITLVIQSIDKIPSFLINNSEFLIWAERTKPWWTAHAVWCAREVITWPFIVMNADDFYGQDALEQAYNFLAHHSADTEHCIITYPIASTLSEYGTVSRGICAVENGKLTKIVEHTKVARKDGKLIHTAEDGHETIVPEDAPANMNLFGFHKSFFEILDRECQKFFREFGQDLKREFFLPSVVMQVIKENVGTITAISTTSSWFGMTYPEDRLEAKNKIQKLVEQGMYL